MKDFIYAVDLYDAEVNQRHFESFEEIKEAGNELVWLKLSEGDTIQKNTLKNALAIKAAGLKIGYYHFATPFTNGLREYNDVFDELNTFWEALQDLPRGDVAPALDLEHHGVDVSREKRDLWCHIFLSGLWDYTGEKPWVYTSKRYVDKYLTDEHGLQIYPLWQVDYGAPDGLPEDWTEVAAEQFTSSYRLPGRKGKLDRNRVRRQFVRGCK